MSPAQILKVYTVDLKVFLLQMCFYNFHSSQKSVREGHIKRKWGMNHENKEEAMSKENSTYSLHTFLCFHRRKQELQIYVTATF